MARGNAALGFQIRQFLVNGLRANGFEGNAETAATGIVGNLAVESGNFDPNVISGKRRGDGGVATGLAQWHPDRWSNLESWAKQNGLDPFTWQAQAGFIIYEMTQGGEKRAWRRLEQAQTPQQAADAFLAYERPSGFKLDDPTGSSHYEDRVERSVFFAGDAPDGMRFADTASRFGQPGIQPPVESSYPMGDVSEMDLSQYTEQERDFIASMGLFEKVRKNMPKLMELPNLLAK